MNVIRIAAFSDGDLGGNPAGVVIEPYHPAETEMRQIAADVGYSETVFAEPEGDAWRIRYFSPESEVPFCGHATIALGAALAMQQGDGVFKLHLNEADITVEGKQTPVMTAALQSPPTRSLPISESLQQEVLALFGYDQKDLDGDFPPARIHAGADHFAFCLNSREALAALSYALDAGRRLMIREQVITILFAWRENDHRFHTRNPFASGGVYEDPATGAATAAFAGYLRDKNLTRVQTLEIVQGVDMGQPSRLQAEFTAEAGSSIRVSGAARIIQS
ncbi:MAG: PhzF family phenazine biosynthesis protein [Pseudomonadota bacterium]